VSIAPLAKLRILVETQNRPVLREDGAANQKVRRKVSLWLI